MRLPPAASVSLHLYIKGKPTAEAGDINNDDWLKITVLI